MSRTGVTFLELMVVIVVMGVLTMIGFPKIRDAIQKTNLRSARAAAGTYVATARQAAIQRGCRGVVHFSPSAGTVWVTVCPRMSPGSGSIDSIGVVSKLGQLYGVTITGTRDSVQFDPRGLNLDNSTTITVRFATTTGSSDSIIVNQLGKVVH
jgi:prepilin-type N-terminal cleavage/methylation domain-containing protein